MSNDNNNGDVESKFRKGRFKPGLGVHKGHDPRYIY